jgi:hypothetical protein
MHDAASWHDFYVALAGGSAALVGLLFVGLSLHLSVIVGLPAIRVLARQTLVNFLTVLLISLFVLIPDQSARALSIEIGITALVNLRGLVSASEAGRRSGRPTWRRLAQRYGSNAVATVALLGVAVGLNVSASAGLGWLVAGVLMLLLLSVWNSWDLLVTLGEDVLAGTDEPTAGVEAVAEGV